MNPTRLRPAAASSVLLVVLSACAPSAGSAPAPTARAAAGPGPSVALPSGRVVKLEVARTDEERAQGLMYRPSMPQDAGMVFLFDSLEARPFWMKNCHFALDMVHTLTDGTVVDVLKGVPPCKAEPCPSYPPKAESTTVVELNAGVADANGVVPGAKLAFRGVEGR